MAMIFRRFRQMDFTATGTPEVLGLAQVATTWLTARHAKAAAGWGTAALAGLFWMVEPYDFCRETFGVNFGPFKEQQDAAQ
mmetsp:Transcript_839/g.1598  ORF Transcript_839/g.1598 Transcript_839/m.1598 type:complete len:81 (+) Transcript_839:102-344(+)